MHGDRTHLALAGVAVIALLLGGISHWVSTYEPPLVIERSLKKPIKEKNVRELLDLLCDRDISMATKHQAIIQLSNYAAFKELQTQIGEMGGIDILGEFLRERKEEIQDETICAIILALSNLTVHATNHTHMVNCKLVAIVATVYEDFNSKDDIQRACLRYLCNLSMWEASAHEICRLPIIHTLVNDLLNSETPGIREGILQLFVNLTDPATASQEDRIAFESILDAVTNYYLMAEGTMSERQSQNASQILRNLSSYAPSAREMESSLRCLDAFSLLDQTMLTKSSTAIPHLS